MAKKVSYNARKKVYIVTEEGKRGIQFQGKEVPVFEDGEDVVWLCENPSLENVPAVVEDFNNDDVVVSESDGKVDSSKDETKIAKVGIFSGLFRS